MNFVKHNLLGLRYGQVTVIDVDIYIFIDIDEVWTDKNLQGFIC